VMRDEWVEVKLGDIFNLVYGKSLSTKNLLNEGYPVFGASSVIGFYSEYKYEEEQVLISCRGAASGTINISPSKVFVTNNSLVVENPSNEKIKRRYLYFMLQGSNRSKIVTGTAQPQVTINNAKTLIIPIAPLPEQRAIVAKIEQLFSELDNGIANLKAAKAKLAIYRQAVLKKAFEGELTKEWREKQANLPTAAELLEQIKEERERHYQKQLEQWKQAVKKWEKNGKEERKPGKPRKVKTLPELSYTEISELTNLPTQWQWVKVDKIQDNDQYSIKAGPFGSSLKKSSYVDTGDYKIYGQEQVISGDSNIGDYFIGADKFQELISCAVKPNDVLISLVGTVGKVLILPDNIKPGIINPRLIKITLSRIAYSSKFFKYYFESAYLKSLYATKSHGATMNIINLGIIQDLPFLLLTLAEQTQIVQEIETRLSVCDNILCNIEEGLVKAEALRQSILKKAFEGKLLNETELAACRQQPDWEPAEKLLARIRRDAMHRVSTTITTTATTTTKTK